MPTENRSSNTDPRDVFIRLNPLGLGEQALRKDSTGFEDQRTHSDYLLFLAGYRETHPEPQPHPEPIAWMVGTAIWWTKEEAERDSAATGLPIVGLGPMTCAEPAEQHQGERAPVEADVFKVISLGVNDSDGPPYKLSLTGDSITEGLDLLGKGLGRIIEQEVMADFERVERVAFEKWAVEAGFEDDALNQGDAVPAWWAWQARAALKRKQ